MQADSLTPASHGRKTFLVGLRTAKESGWVVDEHLAELADLALSAGATVQGRAVQSRRAPHPATYIGRGKAEELAEEAAGLGVELVIFDDDLSPGQAKNLEELLSLPVLDRSGLILEIFDQRARTREARTQVELARLQYMLPRLTRLWGHLSRQVGGIGVRGGEGEKQLEMDRRILRQRIRRLQRDLEGIVRTRGVQRQGRKDVPQVALAGYTNAGKSTLFNRLTRAGTLTENRLFATLDSKLRRGSLADGRVVVFADTVGFIRKLPHHLVASFRSTLEEVTFADLLIHVVDRSHPQWEEQESVARQVLDELGVPADRILTVLNKVDRLTDGLPSHHGRLALSALDGRGLELLKSVIAERLDRSGLWAAGRLSSAATGIPLGGRGNGSDVG